MRALDHPDLSPFAVHLTGRPGSTGNGDPAIAALDAAARLAIIAETCEIRAFATYFPEPFVSFTESTKLGTEYMIRTRGYAPWGIVFTKEFVWNRGGGPALYIRADEWEETRRAPAHLLSRMVRIDPEDGVDWMWEREWRVPGQGSPPSFAFTPDDVVALIVGTREDWPPDRDPAVVYDPATDSHDVDWGIPDWIERYTSWVWDQAKGIQVIDP